MAEGNWVKPGTKPWPSPGEQYPSSGGMGSVERMGEKYGLYGEQAHTLSFVLRSAVTNISPSVMLRIERWLP